MVPPLTRHSARWPRCLILVVACHGSPVRAQKAHAHWLVVGCSAPQVRPRFPTATIKLLHPHACQVCAQLQRISGGGGDLPQECAEKLGSLSEDELAEIAGETARALHRLFRSSAPACSAVRPPSD